jgi:hypothetical protein
MKASWIAAAGWSLTPLRAERLKGPVNPPLAHPQYREVPEL